MPQEKIKWFDNKKGYGFITVDGMEDIFVYYSQIEGMGFKTLCDGEAVEAMRLAWSHLKDKGTSIDVGTPQYRDMHDLMGFPEVWDFEKRWAP